jgi:hypothetical protein
VVGKMADMAIRLAKEPPAAPRPSWEGFLGGRRRAALASAKRL